LQAGIGERVSWLGVTVITGVAAYFLALLLFGMRLGQFRMGAR
jgi:hypothetical protein